jgi:cupin superfamily acireductone dioxygenase involved in methionine salvage
MSEQVNEQKVPSKEEVLAFLMEQIEVKKVQMELQEINMKLAQYRAEELKALSFIGQITNPQPPANAEPHTITQEDMDANPELSEQGFKVGDEVLVEKQQASKQRGLKKDK